MQHDTNSTSSDRSAADREAALTRAEQLVAGMEQDVAERKRKREKPAPKLEPVYMLLFLGFLIAALGGMEGYMRHGKEALLDLGRMPDGFFERIFYDVEGVAFGLGRHLPDYWMLDGTLIGLAALAMFGLREVKPRRRAFSMLSAIVVIAYMALMVTTMFDFTGGIRMRV